MEDSEDREDEDAGTAVVATVDVGCWREAVVDNGVVERESLRGEDERVDTPARPERDWRREEDGGNMAANEIACRLGEADEDVVDEEEEEEDDADADIEVGTNPPAERD